MKLSITARNIAPCRIDLPASKSLFNRAIVIGALSGCIDGISQGASCDDAAVMLRAIASTSDTIDIQASGTAMRFLTALYSITPGTRTLTGCNRMMQRPIGALVDALREAGATITYLGNEGFPPIRIEGSKLHGGRIAIRGDISSQFISAMLLIAPYMTQGLQLDIEGEITSRPYIDMTIGVMQHYGASVRCDGNTICVDALPYTPRELSIEKDWSAASYWYEIAATTATQFTMAHLAQHSLQGDKRMAHYYTLLGVTTQYDAESTVIGHTAVETEQDVIRLNLRNEPDLAPAFIMACALNDRHFCIEGLDNLSIKECDRTAAIISEAAKLGYRFTQPQHGTIAWHGERCDKEQPIVIDPHNDHRIAMAFAPAALRHDTIWIDNPQVVSKSYPTFWEDLKKAGFHITTHP